MSDNKPTFASTRLYLTAKELLGTRIPTANPRLGCVDAVVYVFKKTFNKVLCPDSSTFTLYTILNASPDFIEIEEKNCTAGDLIISPSSFGNGKLSNGHVGIVAKYGILSNNSENGLWQEKWNLEAWKKHYGEFGGFPVAYFRVQDGMSVAVIEQKKTIIERLVLLYKQLIELLSVKKSGSMEQNLGSVEERSKLWYTSRELWVAIATGLAGVFAVVATQYPTIGWIAIVKSILDGLLRVTSTGLPIGGKVGKLGRALLGSK